MAGKRSRIVADAFRPTQSLRYVPTRANGQLALGVYRMEAETGDYVPIALDVLTLRARSVAAVTVFRDRLDLRPLRAARPALEPAGPHD